tara:strand:- start:707 stop:883 length:177 start_codon:yes stop_codon:yes gene_type:complete
MPTKIDDRILARLLQLKGIGLTDKVISIRLGISERTVRVYTRAKRTGLKPYEKPDDVS